MKVQEDEIYDCKFFTKDEILAEDEVYPQIKEIIKTFRFEQKKI
jgi:NADH pyrophosphatase NudC (nudix superfamily)